MDNNSMIIYLACICFLFLFGKIFILPIKSILKLVFNSILGGVMIFIINLIGGIFGFHIGLNYITAIFTGILGVPRSYFISSFKISFRCIKIKNTREIMKNLVFFYYIILLLNLNVKNSILLKLFVYCMYITI